MNWPPLGKRWLVTGGRLKAKDFLPFTERDIHMQSVASENQNGLQLYSSRIINNYIKFLAKKYDYINIEKLLHDCQMERYEVEDEGHWFSQEQVDRFYEQARKLTGNPAIAREAGRYASSPDNLGIFRQYALGLMNPGAVYAALGRVASNFTRSSNFEIKKVHSNKVTITVVPKEGIREKPYQCESRTGYIEAISLAFNHRLPKVEHTECMFQDGKVCRYEVSWRESKSIFWRKIRNVSAALVTGFCGLSFFAFPSYEVITLLSSCVFVLLVLTFYTEQIHKEEVNAVLKIVRESNDQLIDQINVNYNNALLVNEVGKALSKQVKLDRILSNVIEVLSEGLDYDRGMIMLVDDERKHVGFAAGFGYAEEQLEVLRSVRFGLKNPASKGVFVESIREQKPFLINDVDDILNRLSPRSIEFVKKLGTKSFICCPIVYEKESIGILAVDNTRTKRPLLQSDMSLLMGIAPEIGISIRNALLIESKEQQFKSIVKVLAASIDARDPLTAGHSEKVTEYVTGICRELRLPKETGEIIKVASLLHDYGKIGIRDSILLKNSTLSVEEREEVKTHAEKSRKILEQINFEGLYAEVPEIVGAHHERVDGTGYPNGLRGEEIPLGARIIAVADVFEAVTAKRLYREPMSVDAALELLTANKGTHLDGQIVDAFIGYYTREHLGNGHGNNNGNGARRRGSRLRLMNAVGYARCNK